MRGAAEFAPPVKRSVTIAGHETSVALEPMFWEALERAATASGRPLNALIARVDAARLEAPNPPNLASALRQWLFRQSGESH
jgi:predicted DNA-binding ribbon-helix-helix protein